MMGRFLLSLLLRIPFVLGVVVGFAVLCIVAFATLCSLAFWRGFYLMYREPSP